MASQRKHENERGVKGVDGGRRGGEPASSERGCSGNGHPGDKYVRGRRKSSEVGLRGVAQRTGRRAAGVGGGRGSEAEEDHARNRAQREEGDHRGLPDKPAGTVALRCRQRGSRQRGRRQRGFCDIRVVRGVRSGIG